MRINYGLSWQSTDREDGGVPGLAEIAQALAENEDPASGEPEDYREMWQDDKKRIRALSGRWPWVLFTLTREDQDGGALRVHALEGRTQEVRGQTVFPPPDPESME